MYATSSELTVRSWLIGYSSDGRIPGWLIGGVDLGLDDVPRDAYELQHFGAGSTVGSGPIPGKRCNAFVVMT
jgi:hypothetical protein